MREPNSSVRAGIVVSGTLVAFLFLTIFPTGGVGATAPTQETSVVEPLSPRSPQPVTPGKAKKETKGTKDSKRLEDSIPHLAKQLDETINILERDINDTAEVAKTSVKVRASQMLREVQQAQRELARSESEAQRLAMPTAIDLPPHLSSSGANTSAVIPTLILADAAVISQTLHRVVLKVGELRQDVDSRLVPVVQRVVQGAPESAEKNTSQALKETHKMLVVPLKDSLTLLKSLSGKPQTASKTALMKVGQQFDLVRSRTEATLGRMAGQIGSQAFQALGSVAGNANQVAEVAQRVEKMVDAMRRLSEQRTQAALNQLDRLIAISPEVSATPAEGSTDLYPQTPTEQVRKQVLAVSQRIALRLTALLEETRRLQNQQKSPTHKRISLSGNEGTGII